MKNNNTVTPIAISANGIEVFSHPEGHSHRPDLDAEAINKISLPEGTFCRTTVDMGRVIGKDHLVETTDLDTIIYLRRGNRAGETRMVIKEAKDTSNVTVILCVAHAEAGTPNELVGKWVLVTLFEGNPGEREPWDRSFDNADIDEGVAEAKQRCEAFWTTHALVPTEEEYEAIKRGDGICKLDILESWIDGNKTKYYLTNGEIIIVEDNSGDYVKDFSAELLDKDGKCTRGAYMYETISPVSGDRTEEQYASSMPEEYKHILRVINEDLYPCCLLTDLEASELKFQ